VGRREERCQRRGIEAAAEQILFVDAAVDQCGLVVPRQEWVGDDLDLVWSGSRGGQRRLNRLRGKPGRLLDAVETLFPRGEQDAAVLDQRGRAVLVEWRNAENLHTTPPMTFLSRWARNSLATMLTPESSAMKNSK